MNPTEAQFIKDQIKTEAKNLGFTHIGFTDPLPPKNVDIYFDWIRSGFHADMSYLGRQDRLEKIKNPNLILPSCKSMIVLALPYNPPNYKLNSKKFSFGKIASYAMGEDYHLIIPKLLSQLIEKIKSNFPKLVLEYKIYTDTGPIMEKAFAQKAGLGWIGKNSCLIIPGIGSYFFLSEILINIEIPSDAPFDRDFCGQCSACVDACPTKCIMKNRTLDSKNCISYLTIENKSEIPLELRKKVGEWLFGCDICQNVCPWNIRFSKTPQHNYFQPQAEFSDGYLNDLYLFSQDEFNQKFLTHPFKRTKRKGFYRNLCTVLGNLESSENLPFLEKLIKNETDPIIINHAKWASDQIKK